MPDAWEFHSPVHVLFGDGRLDAIGGLVRGRALIVTTAGTVKRGLVDRVLSGLDDGATVVHDSVTTNPTVTELRAAIEILDGHRFDTVVAIGGGSSIDTAKLLALALAPRELRPPTDLLNDSAQWSDVDPLPVIAVPTTAGTGSEVTPFATVWDDRTGTKRSVGTRRMHPVAAIVDPVLTHSLPWDVTLSTGLDALSQCLESIANRRATPITTALAVRGADLAHDSLIALRWNATDSAARRGMAEAALLSGLAIAHTRTSLAHSMSYPVTVKTGLPHGLACALFLPAVLDFMAEPGSEGLEEPARALGAGDARNLGRHVLDLYDVLGVDSEIRRYVSDPALLRELSDGMLAPERADNSLRPVDAGDIDAIVEATVGWLEASTR